MPPLLLHSSNYHPLFTPNSTPSSSSSNNSSCCSSCCSSRRITTTTTRIRAWRRGHSLDNRIVAAGLIHPQACTPWSTCTSRQGKSKSGWRAFSRANYSEDGEGAANPYELDKTKALEALQQLDEQLEALSVVPEKKRDSSPKLPGPEFSTILDSQ